MQAFHEVGRMATRDSAQVSELAARQWGLLTTAKAEAERITRLQHARLPKSSWPSVLHARYRG